MEIQGHAGPGAAHLAQAREEESHGRHELARGWLARAVRSGEPAALRLLAESLMLRDPVRPRDGAEMMREAAMHGDARAAFICATIAGQGSDDPSRWVQALDFLSLSEQLGSQEAARARTLLGAAHDIRAGEDTVRATSQLCFAAPRIGICERFASDAECDWLMARAAPRLKAAQVYDPASGGGLRESGMRNNRDASFDICQSDLVLVALRARMAAMLDVDVRQMEPAMVLHYRPGQYFAPHCDGLDAALPPLAREITAKGQRIATVLVYLNDDYAEGQTDFPDLDWRFKGRKGDALWFWNVDREGALDRATRHAGVTPQDGEKWLLSQWIREPRW